MREPELFRRGDVYYDGVRKVAIIDGRNKLYIVLEEWPSKFQKGGTGRRGGYSVVGDPKQFSSREDAETELRRLLRCAI